MALSNAALDQKMVESMSRFLCNPFQSKAFDLKTPARTDLVRSAFSHIFRGFAVRKSPRKTKNITNGVKVVRQQVLVGVKP